MIQEILRVEGMRGERDRRAVLAALEALPGVRRAAANLADRTLRVERDDATSLASVIDALQRAGYPVAVLV